MLFLLAAFACGAIIAPLLLRYGRFGYLILSVIPAAAFLVIAVTGRSVLHGIVAAENWAWVPQLGLQLTFRLDHLSWVMALIVTGIGTLVLIYCTRYFSATAAGMGRFAGVFLGFAGAMLGLVTTDNTLALYLFWELTTVFSFLLIGHYYDKPASRRAAMQAIIVTTAGGLAMLAGIVLFGEMPGGSYRISELVAAAQDGTLGVAPITAESASGTLISFAVVLILWGAISKSALIPFHFWLPSAMAAPTPVSAYLHAAAMVKAGVYLVARLAPGFSNLPAWRWIILLAGAGTLLIGGFRALKQYDLKLVLAFGTVSQLGLITLMVGYGTPALLLAGLGMLVGHALFKATLFLAVGQIDWSTGTRDLRELSGLWRAMPITAVASALAGASMMGLPFFAGFVAKEAALHALIGGTARDTLTWILIAVGSALTVGYTLRFWWGAFWAKPGVAPLPVKHRSWLMVLPVAVLSLGGPIFGVFPRGLERALSPHANQIPGDAGHLVAWAGFGPAFYVTCLVLVAGGVIFALRGPFEQLTSRYKFPFAAESGYQRIIAGLSSLSGTTTSLTQRGSLPAYLATIFVFTLGTVLLALSLGGLGVPVEMRWADTPPQAFVVVVTIAAALLAARTRHRLKAVLLMGVSGYGVAFIYELYGAPDLALTQALAETMTLVVFLLVLRRLPTYFSRRPLRFARGWRIFVAAMVGTAAALLAVLAAAAREAEPIATKFHDEAYAYGYGKNIVNVTLVDIRAWDTFGEISVLVACAIGVSSLLFIRDRGGRIDRFRNIANLQTTISGKMLHIAPERHGSHWRGTASSRNIAAAALAPGRNRTWLTGTENISFHRRSVILEVGTRVVFHSILVVSVFFLFSGHNQPGGGFAGGLLAGIALVLRYLAGGRYELGAAIPLHPGHLMGAGLSIAGLSAIVPIAAGGTILQTAKIDLVLPVFGEVHLATAVFFDIGVYLVVIGLILDILRSLGAEIDRHGELEGIDDVDANFILAPALDARLEDHDAQHLAHYYMAPHASEPELSESEPEQLSESEPEQLSEVDQFVQRLAALGIESVAIDPATTSQMVPNDQAGGDE
ncbi:MAG: Na+/H+ antiporter subunit A [Trueperella sp.]|nr:Na+/H+ antiporter subunit A [Trueperella sp.]